MITSKLDIIASGLESRGLAKFAKEIDRVSDMLDSKDITSDQLEFMANHARGLKLYDEKISKIHDIVSDFANEQDKDHSAIIAKQGKKSPTNKGAVIAYLVSIKNLLAQKKEIFNADRELIKNINNILFQS